MASGNSKAQKSGGGAQTSGALHNDTAYGLVGQARMAIGAWYRVRLSPHSIRQKRWTRRYRMFVTERCAKR